MKKLKNKIYKILKIPNYDYLVKEGLEIGNNVSIQEDVFIDPSHCWLISIGDECTIAPRVMILAHDASTKRHIGYTKIGKVSIGKKTFIGAGSIILPNITIGDKVIIGAGSVVTKNIPSNSIAVGNPAKIIGNIKDYIEKNKENLNKKHIYSEEWTYRENISDEMKDMMKKSLLDEGYVK